MKRFLFALIVLFAFSFYAKAQIYVKGKPVPDTAKYVLIHSYTSSGQGVAKYIDGRNTTRKEFITDKEGRKIIFNYLGDIIDFMEKHGYDYVDAYAIAYQSDNFAPSRELYVIFKKHED